MNRKLSDKIITTHPVSGRKMNIDSTIYNSFKAVILKSLKGSKGKTFTELNNDVNKIIKKQLSGFNGSVSWYTITIRLDLEAKGIIETFVLNGKKLAKIRK